MVLDYAINKINIKIPFYIKFCTDNFIQRTKQRYNNTRSLSTKMNLADMQTEIKLRPPYQISVSELGSANGFSHVPVGLYKGTGKISAGKFQTSVVVSLNETDAAKLIFFLLKTAFFSCF